MQEITIAIARAALVSAIAERGTDYVYPGAETGQCFYSVDGKPSCIVGLATSKIGAEYFEAIAEEEKLQYDLDGDGLPFYNVKSLPVEEHARRALLEAQTLQDAGATWGVALEAFDNAVARLVG